MFGVMLNFKTTSSFITVVLKPMVARKLLVGGNFEWWVAILNDIYTRPMTISLFLLVPPYDFINEGTEIAWSTQGTSMVGAEEQHDV